jgi:hypothetical protein
MIDHSAIPFQHRLLLVRPKMRQQRGVSRHLQPHKVVTVHRRQIKNASTERAVGRSQPLAVIYWSGVGVKSSLDNFESPSKRQKVTRLASSHRSQTSVSSPRIYRARPNVRGDAGDLQCGQDNFSFRISQRTIKS